MTHRLDGRGHWPKGRRRNDCPDIAIFIRRAASARQIGRLLLGVDEKTVRRWASGRCRPPIEQIERLIELLWPISAGALPLAGDYPLDGQSRVGGVGDYTLRAANGCCNSDDFSPLGEMSWDEMTRKEDEIWVG